MKKRLLILITFITCLVSCSVSNFINQQDRDTYNRYIKGMNHALNLQELTLNKWELDANQPYEISPKTEHLALKDIKSFEDKSEEIINYLDKEISVDKLSYQLFNSYIKDFAKIELLIKRFNDNSEEKFEECHKSMLAEEFSNTCLSEIIAMNSAQGAGMNWMGYITDSDKNNFSNRIRINLQRANKLIDKRPALLLAKVEKGLEDKRLAHDQKLKRYKEQYKSNDFGISFYNGCMDYNMNSTPEGIAARQVSVEKGLSIEQLAKTLFDESCSCLAASYSIQNLSATEKDFLLGKFSGSYGNENLAAFHPGRTDRLTHVAHAAAATCIFGNLLKK